MTRMIDISDKKDILRIATARGRIYLHPETINHIRNKTTKKGDPLQVAEIASTLAAKNTPIIIPLCHQIPLTNIVTDFTLKEDYVEVTVTIKAVAKTGVEMEALVAVFTALTNIWDMTKYLEKDAKGQYPTTTISDIRVIQKIKKKSKNPQ